MAAAAVAAAEAAAYWDTKAQYRTCMYLLAGCVLHAYDAVNTLRNFAFKCQPLDPLLLLLMFLLLLLAAAFTLAAGC
jgi:hypothetical protein